MTYLLAQKKALRKRFHIILPFKVHCQVNNFFIAPIEISWSGGTDSTIQNLKILDIDGEIKY